MAQRTNYKLLTKWCEMHQGLSLIEVLLFVLVAMALVTVLLSSAGVLDKTRGSNLETVATGVGSCEIERLRKLNFASLPTSGAVGSPCNTDLTLLPPPNSAYRTVSTFQNDANIVQVTITVTWTEKGIAKSTLVETLISKYGL